MVTISSSESLRSNPVVEVTVDKPEKGEDLTNQSPLRVSLVTGSLTRWEATFENQVNQASRQYVVVSGTDLSDNSATVGDATNEDDIVTFQVDDRPPTVLFMDASGKDLGRHETDRGRSVVSGAVRRGRARGRQVQGA